MMYPALFLDRDGVIIENRANYVRSWSDVEFFPQALTALAQICQSPYKIIMVTNQSAVGRGIISYETALDINNRVVDVIEAENGRIDAAYICPDAPGSSSLCRKPQPGMLLQAAQEHNIDLKQSIMVGDALTDVQAGKNAGVKYSVMVLTGRGRAQVNLPEAPNFAPIPIYADLTAVFKEFVLPQTIH
ncbi:MAG: HAD family hydrolase [Chloroflexi bacterium]|nr:HAD family hydrolase [Chloroflexota bacterium]